MNTLPAGVSIRPFTPADQLAARALILSGLAEHFGWADEHANPDIENIATSYLAAGNLFLVAVRSSAPAPGWGISSAKARQAGPATSETHREQIVVGTAGLIVEGNGSGRVVRVSVDCACRRQGIARALLQELCTAAAARGIRRLWMETNEDWPDALDFYQALGFREYDRRDGCVYLALDSLQP